MFQTVQVIVKCTYKLLSTYIEIETDRHIEPQLKPLTTGFTKSIQEFNSVQLNNINNKYIRIFHY